MINIFVNMINSEHCTATVGKVNGKFTYHIQFKTLYISMVTYRKFQIYMDDTVNLEQLIWRKH